MRQQPKTPTLPPAVRRGMCEGFGPCPFARGQLKMQSRNWGGPRAPRCVVMPTPKDECPGWLLRCPSNWQDPILLRALRSTALFLCSLPGICFFGMPFFLCALYFFPVRDLNTKLTFNAK